VAKTLRTVATIVGAVALAATGVGLVGSATLLASIGTTLGASVSTIATVANVVAASAALGSQLLAKPPPAAGTVNNVTIGANQPIPYGMGRSFIAGAQLHDMGYGGKVDGVNNPYRSVVLAWSAGGPAQEFESFLLDWQPVTFSGGNATGWYADYLYLDTQLGTRPEGSALTGPWGAFTGWDSTSKLSSYAAGLVSFKFDKKGKRWANSIPSFGAVFKWAKVYDWRLDSTMPGGSGSHRWDDEDTFEWDRNVALNAVTYARGRFSADSGGEMVVGIGYPDDAIDWPAWTAFANLCDANGWGVDGHVYDGPETSRWDNLKRICEAGGGEPTHTGGLLSVKFPAPTVAVDTITRDDLADGECVVPTMRTFRDRVNAVVPAYRSEMNRWEVVQSERIENAAMLAEDLGQPKEMQWPLELVTDADQAAQVSAYALWNAREIDGITLLLKPRLWEYKLGEAIELDLPELGLEGDHVISAVDRDAGTGTITLTFLTEDAAKHADALAQVGTAPPPPVLPAHGEEDQGVWENEQENNPILLTDAGDDLTTNSGDPLYRG
jgi:hypothetical protein